MNHLEQILAMLNAVGAVENDGTLPFITFTRRGEDTSSGPQEVLEISTGESCYTELTFGDDGGLVGWRAAE